MLRISKPMTSAKAAIEYYDSHLSKSLEGYYLKNQSFDLMFEQDSVERVGRWFGKTAQMFGIEGEVVDRETFSKLANHINPVTDESLTMRRKDNRRVLTDFSIHVPKTVSAAAIHDERISDALLEVGREVMGEIERDVQVRVRASGQNTNRVSGNIIASEHLHTTTRPLKSTGIPQAHWHLHYALMNVSFDAVEKKFKAAELGNVHFDRPYYEALAHNLMASKLQELGYAIRRTSDAYEIAGIPDSVKEKFSGRSQEVAALVEELGLTSAEAKANAGAWSRERKTKTFQLNTLRDVWDDQLTFEERAAVERARRGDADTGEWAASAPISSREAVDWSMRHWHESQSTINKRRAIATALKYGVGHVTHDDIEGEMSREGILQMRVKGEERVGSRHVLEQEQDAINRAKAGRGSRRKLIPGKLQLNSIDEEGKTFELNEDQLAAIKHIGSSRDKTILIQGRAGTGKTRMMKSAVQSLLEQAAVEVITLAPTARAGRGVLREEGFENADTLQRFLDSPEQLTAAKGKVVWLDEGAIASADDLSRLLKAADQHDFERVIIQGDSAQHQSVKRSAGLFNLLKTHAGLRPAVLSTVMRQKGDYAKAEKLIGAGKIDEGFGLLDKLGMIVEVATDDLYKQAAQNVVESLKRGVSTGVGSPIRDDGRRVTNAIRATLREQRRLGLSERKFLRLESRHLSEAEREVPANYRQDDVVQFMKKVKGFRVGERVRVTHVAGDAISVIRPNGKLGQLPHDASNARKFDVFAERKLVIAEGERRRAFTAGDRVSLRKKDSSEYSISEVRGDELMLNNGDTVPKRSVRRIHAGGDKIRITANGKTLDGKRVNNGDIVQAKRFTKAGDIELTDGRILGKDFATWDLGWSMTSVASQGAGFDQHIVVCSTDSFGPAINMRQFYVDSSRGKGKSGLMIYTDDKAGLRQAVQRVGGDMSMTESLDLHTNQVSNRLPSRSLRQRYDSMQASVRWAATWVSDKIKRLSNHYANRPDVSHRPPEMG